MHTDKTLEIARESVSGGGWLGLSSSCRGGFRASRWVARNAVAAAWAAKVLAVEGSVAVEMEAAEAMAVAAPTMEGSVGNGSVVAWGSAVTVSAAATDGGDVAMNAVAAA